MLLRPTGAALGFGGGSGGSRPQLRPCSATHRSQGAQVRSSLASVCGSQTTTSPRRARVKATFTRRQSAVKPMPPAAFERTVDITIASFSRPWKLSTEFTSTPPKSRPVLMFERCSSRRSSRACAP